jgi:hypothetical protein
MQTSLFWATYIYTNFDFRELQNINVSLMKVMMVVALDWVTNHEYELFHTKFFQGYKTFGRLFFWCVNAQHECTIIVLPPKWFLDMSFGVMISDLVQIISTSKK